jgi:hypothetical protein
LGDFVIDRKILLKYISKHYVRAWNRFNWLRIRSSRENDTEPSFWIYNGREFLDQLRNCQVLKEDFTLWTQLGSSLPVFTWSSASTYTFSSKRLTVQRIHRPTWQQYRRYYQNLIRNIFRYAFLSTRYSWKLASLNMRHTDYLSLCYQFSKLIFA